MKRVLILTAGYGDGHNSAARAVGEVLQESAEVRVCDVCAEALPEVFKWTKRLYLWMTARVPWLWRCLYDLSDTSDWSGGVPPGLGPVAVRLRVMLDEWKPDAVVCTFPLYPYLLDVLFRQGVHRVPYMTVVTDSLAISRTWLESDARLFAVSDEGTRSLLVEEKGIAPDRVVVTHFPVSPKVHAGDEAKSWCAGQAFKVLYVPQGRPSLVEEELVAMLDAAPEVRVTVVLGHKVRRLYRAVHGAALRAGRDRVRILGWTHRMPQLLASHHVLVGKAGGASVHEALAAEVPVLVNHFVPGQEEGNTELLHRLGGGRFVSTPAELRRALQFLLDQDGSAWSVMKQRLHQARMKGGAAHIAELVQQLDDFHV
ncbi:MGDG synthase family glycosyltransferase [Akkermansia glycaniphila]|uniref:Monogalactosyldiacylglycerol (Mgdg) synthase n=1 Tax=Akkermansia glycaniphila TaxID=1679444 RepID=A0A1C7PB80_9BACT|nr:hypothetical protein [Akkermansia glycaniphila]OCA02688.1 hypothetical protein AC781_09460 [Akkermansia glycaniphila]SEH77218.1 monogalactosyldiacylglycerol (mgdg) synthase [Akkermansia glycaniphila]